tara:strand:+ start:1339 stop:2745 length:1407 start_codon:yes stop_codon:yes gene_type:complete
MAIKFLHDLDVQGNINLNDNQALNAVLQHLGTDPSPEEGKIYYNTTNNVVMACLGTTASDWTELSFGDITEIIGGTRITVTGGTTGAATVNLDSATVSEITTNTAKTSNVSTNLSEGTTTNTTVDVNSSDGSNATLASASTSRAGLMSKAKFDEVVANTAKTGITTGESTKLGHISVSQAVDLDTMESNINTNNSKVSNVTTDLSTTGTTGNITIVSSDGTDATIPVVSSTKSGIITPTQLDTLDSAAPIISPALSGTPTAPTAAANTNTTQIATTAYVQTEITDLIGGAPGALDTLNELAEAIDDDASYASTITAALGGKSPTAGNTSLTTVGTIGTGTWQGSAINQTYITGLAGNNTGDEPDANTTTKGIAERATVDEAKAGTDGTRFVTPAGIAARTYTTTVGGTTSQEITHGLNTLAVMVQLYDTTTYDTVHAKVVRNHVNKVTVSFSSAPASGRYTVVVTKIQ